MSVFINGTEHTKSVEKAEKTCHNCKWFTKNREDLRGESGVCSALPPLPVATLDRINFMRCATEAKNVCSLWGQK